MEPFAETILIIDDDPDIREILRDCLQALGFLVLLASTGKEGLELVDQQAPQLVLLDIELPDIKGLDVLKEIRKRRMDLPVVMITAYGSVDRAVQAMKEGAYDFITKPFELDHLCLVVRNALERERLQREVEILSHELDERYRLVVGKSIKMNEAMEMAKKAASTKSTVLLLGESGTGKELFAHAIHNWSERRDQPFVVINCVGLSRELLESELFGHEKGSFTGAHELKRGKMELAHGGTVFLDEVGDISPEVQTKLLRFLQEREFERLGGTKLIRVDVRIIAATNRNLEGAVKEGRFREDLYHRLNVIPIVLPPLKERKEDIPSLASCFMQKFSKEAKKNFTELTKEALEKLLAYDWPGNVRELANVIERAVVLGQGPQLPLHDLPANIVSATSDPPRDDLSYHEAINDYRREMILKTLAQTQGNRAAAAKILGLQRTYLSRLIKALRID
jgi:DNA-binding NtrC family response regulator